MLVTALIAALAVPFSILHTSEIRVRLKSPIMDRRAPPCDVRSPRHGDPALRLLWAGYMVGHSDHHGHRALYESRLARLEHGSSHQRYAGSHWGADIPGRHSNIPGRFFSQRDA
jgi:hypothetical protein